MCEYSSVDGFANDWHFVHLGSRAVGGAAMVMTEASAVLAGRAHQPARSRRVDGRSHPDACTHFPFHRRSWRSARDAIGACRTQGQHCSAVGRGGPWTNRNKAGDRSLAERDPVFAGVADTRDAGRSRNRANCRRRLRTRRGELGKRARKSSKSTPHMATCCMSFFRRCLTRVTIATAARSRIERASYAKWCTLYGRPGRQAFPLFVRISATDWAAGGWTIDDSVALAKQLQPLGVDLVDCSSGGAVPNLPIPAGPGFQVPFAERIRKEAGILTAAVGMITGPSRPIRFFAPVKPTWFFSPANSCAIPICRCAQRTSCIRAARGRSNILARKGRSELMRETEQISAKTERLESRITDKARKVREHQVLTLSRRDRQVFVDALLRPDAPSERLRDAARRYKSVLRATKSRRARE